LQSSVYTDSESFSWKAEIIPSRDAEHYAEFLALEQANAVKSSSLILIVIIIVLK
jgi:hypothetical protein